MRNMISSLCNKSKKDLNNVQAFLLGGISTIMISLIALLPYDWATSLIKFNLVLLVTVLFYGGFALNTFYSDLKQYNELAEERGNFNIARLFDIKKEQWTYELRNGSVDITCELQVRNIHKKKVESIPIIRNYSIYDLNDPSHFSPKNLSVTINDIPINYPNLIKQKSTTFYTDILKSERPDKKEICNNNELNIIATDIIEIPLKLHHNEEASILIKYNQNDVFSNFLEEEWAGVINQFFNSSNLVIIVKPPEGHELFLKYPNFRHCLRIEDRVIGREIHPDTLHEDDIPTLNDNVIKWSVHNPIYNHWYKVHFYVKESRENPIHLSN